MNFSVYSRMFDWMHSSRLKAGAGPALARQRTAPAHRVVVAFALTSAVVAPHPAQAEPAQTPPQVAAAQVVPAQTDPQSADQLFTRFATLTGLEATFVEVKKLSLLKQPLRSEGTLYYMRPGYLLREVTKPKPTRVLITPQSLELNDGQTERHIDLRARPDVKLFVESFTKVLAGDQAALATGFDIQFAPRPQAATAPEDNFWKLTLTPKSAPLNQLVQKLVLSGKGYAVERISVVETKGDTSETTLHVSKVGRQFSAEEKQALFGVGADQPAQ